MAMMDWGQRMLLFIVLLSLLPLNIYASNHVDEDDSSIVDWSRTYGGDGIDVGCSMQRTKDGGYVIAGYTDSFGAGNYDVYLLKTDSEGNLIWNKTYGGDRSDVGESVQETSDGGYIIVGKTNSFGNKYRDVYLVRIDSEGNELWSRTYGIQGTTNNIEWGYSVKQTNDGGYLIAGRTNSSDRGEKDLCDVYLVKTDPEGNLIWNKTYGGDRSDEAFSVQETSDGGCIIAGETRSFGDEDCDIYLIRVDLEGNELWSRTYGDIKGDERGYSVQKTSDGGYIIAGVTWLLNSEDPDFYLVKTDSDGNELWSGSYTGPDGRWSQDWGRSVLETGDGGYILVGETYSNVERDQDVLLVKTDSLGNLLWRRILGGSDRDWGYSVLETGDGGYIISGYTSSFGAGEYDIYITKTKPLPVSVSISCQVSVETVRRGEGVTISGEVDPPIKGMKITLTYTRPDGSKITRDVETDEEGIFKDRCVLDVPGVWNASPSIEDDVYYATAGSSQVSVTVKEASRQPLHLYGLIVAIITIIILGVWLLLRKRS